MPTVVVAPGDTIPSLARQYGFLSQTLWDHPRNAALKSKRKDPNILCPGDEVFVPDKEIKEADCATGKKSSFVLKGEPHKYKVQLRKMGGPRANEPFVLDIDGTLIEGNTDANGRIEVAIAADARSGKLVLKNGKEVYPIRFGELDPIDEITGVQQRLNNLGFDCGSEDGELHDQTRAAIRAFQQKYKLEATGEADAATKAKLLSLHE